MVSMIIAGFIFSIIGWFVYRHGKKNANIHLAVVGMLLMIYPILTPKAWATWVVGFILCGFAYYFKDY